MTKILVIDDDSVVRVTVVQILEDEGYDVASAEYRLRGMAVLRKEQPDLVITDIIMPEQEGIQTMPRSSRANQAGKGTGKETRQRRR